MLVKNILKNTSKILGMIEVAEYLESMDSELYDNVSEDINNMLLAVNMTNNNIASNYIDLVGKVSVNNDYNILPFSMISDKDIIEIKSVYSGGKKIDFKVVPEGLKTARGNIEILYSYFPSEVGINDVIDYYTKLNALTFAQGVAGEFLFLKGDIDNAYVWDKKFKQSLINLIRSKKNLVMPAKRWY